VLGRDSGVGIDYRQSLLGGTFPGAGRPLVSQGLRRLCENPNLAECETVEYHRVRR